MLLVNDSSGRLSCISCSDFRIARTIAQTHMLIDASLMRSEPKVAMSCSNNLIKLWDIQDGRQLASMNSPRQATSLDFSTSPNLLVSGHKDGKLRLWDCRVGKRQDVEIFVSATGLTSVKCLNLTNQVVATSTDSRLSSIDLRMQHTLLWQVRDSSFESPGTGQCLSLSNNDSFVVVNSK